MKSTTETGQKTEKYGFLVGLVGSDSREKIPHERNSELNVRIPGSKESMIMYHNTDESSKGVNGVIGTGASGALTPAPPHVINDNAGYTVSQAGKLLGLPKSCLPREVRLCRLRVSKRAGRYFVLGKWLLEWLEAGERRKEKAGCPETSV